MPTNGWLIGAGLGALLVSATPALAQSDGSDPLAKIGHIVVILEENHSFDNLFGKFPGANGLANAGYAATQIGPDGKPYKFLPAPVDTDLKPPEVDKRFSAQLPNRPFLLNHFVSLDDDTGDLIHEFYTEQRQINDGAMDRYAELSNAKGLAMGSYDLSGYLSVETRAAVHDGRCDVSLGFWRFAAQSYVSGVLVRVACALAGCAGGVGCQARSGDG